MSNRKTALLYLVPVVLTSLLVGMVIASRFGLSPSSIAQTVAAPPMNSAPLTGTVSASTFRDIAKNVSPAVVNIRTESRQRTRDLTEFFGGGGGGGDDLFERFFGQPNPNRGRAGRPGAQGQGQGRPRDQLVQAAGTGFIIDKSGLILTNNHVVEGAPKIVVYLFGEEADAEGYEAQDRRPRPAERQRADRADPEAQARRSPRSSSATRRRCSRAIGCWRSATRSASTTPSASA